MSNAELSDSSSLTPPLEEIDKQWQRLGVDDDVINIGIELSPKRQKVEEFEADGMSDHFVTILYVRSGTRVSI